MTLELIDRLCVRSPFRHGPTLLHPECPIEQAVTSTDFQVRESLLREIWRRTPAHEYGTLLIAHPDRLRVLARTEALLLSGTIASLSQVQRDVNSNLWLSRYLPIDDEGPAAA